MGNFISTLAEKIGVVEAAAFFKQRAGKSKPEDMRWFLEHAPHEPPLAGDEYTYLDMPTRKSE